MPSTLGPWPSFDRLGLDHLGTTQAIGGLVLGLIALFSSYDHITIAGRSLPLQQQWGIVCILALVATILSKMCHTARHLGATLNWRRDPDFETRMHALRKDRQRIESEIEQL